MAVIVQPAFRIEVLALEAQRVVDFSDVESADLAVGAVVGGPDDFAIRSCEFLRRAEVVELVMVGLGVLWAEAFQQGERPKTIGFVEVAAMPIRMVLGDQLFALPEKLGRYAINGFADAPPKRVVAVAGGLAIGLSDAYQAMLAVVAVFSDLTHAHVHAVHGSGCRRRRSRSAGRPESSTDCPPQCPGRGGRASVDCPLGCGRSVRAGLANGRRG